MLEKPAFFPCRDVGRGSVPEADMGRCGQSEISGRCPHVRWQPCFGRVAGKGAITFRIDLPGRGHAAAAHPNRPEAIAFARRPGTFAIILDCLSGKPVNLVEAPPNRHFCRHGAYSADGELLFTTENDFFPNPWGWWAFGMHPRVMFGLGRCHPAALGRTTCT